MGGDASKNWGTGIIGLLSDYSVAFYVDDFIQKAQTMSADQAESLLDRFESVRRQRVELDEKFRPRFETAITPQKTLLLFQLNFIFDAVVNYDLAGMVPLTH